MLMALLHANTSTYQCNKHQNEVATLSAAVLPETDHAARVEHVEGDLMSARPTAAPSTTTRPRRTATRTSLRDSVDLSPVTSGRFVVLLIRPTGASTCAHARMSARRKVRCVWPTFLRQAYRGARISVLGHVHHPMGRRAGPCRLHERALRERAHGYGRAASWTACHPMVLST